MFDSCDRGVYHHQDHVCPPQQQCLGGVRLPPTGVQHDKPVHGLQDVREARADLRERGHRLSWRGGRHKHTHVARQSLAVRGRGLGIEGMATGSGKSQQAGVEWAAGRGG